VRFVDAQEAGPYRAWWHEHRFQREGRRTLMEDRVYYAAPLGPLGRIANALFISRTLQRIFGYRERVIRMRFGGPSLTSAGRAWAERGPDLRAHPAG
jgi:hypothetical protein